jgi:hypothetical protein
MWKEIYKYKKKKPLRKKKKKYRLQHNNPHLTNLHLDNMGKIRNK